MKNVVVLGSGFAGLWAAVGAARRLDELHIPAGDVVVTVISSQPFHDIRVRNYESDLTACRIPLSDVLDPIGVVHITADVTAIDTVATHRDDSRALTDSAPRTTTGWCSRWAVLWPDPTYPVCANSASTSTPTTGR